MASTTFKNHPLEMFVAEQKSFPAPESLQRHYDYYTTIERINAGKLSVDDRIQLERARKNKELGLVK